MEFGQYSPRTPGPSRSNQENLINMTILSTPRPQATSTVERRTFSSQYGDNVQQYRLQQSSNADDTVSMSNNSSLGLLSDISSRSVIDDQDITSNSNRLESERRLARELLQKLSEQDERNSMDINKENNANSQNLSIENTPPTLTDIYFSQGTEHKDSIILSTSVSKTSINSIVFEPNEITGRSSEKSKSPESSHFQSDEFSFNSTAVSLMAKFANEEFVAGSRMNSQLAADEISWRQSYNPIPPSAEKERLDFSCFSGIIGDLDLSVESCAGRKVSVGEFFSRKCETLGQLSSHGVYNRPTFGFDIQSPKRSKPAPLINDTSTTDIPTDSATKSNQDEKLNTSCTSSSIDDTKSDDEPLISLSGIAKALDSNDNPRRLVDHLLMVKKKEKGQKEGKPADNGNTTAGTYTIPCARSSLPFFNDSSQKSAGKLSLDSKVINNSTNSIARSSVTANSFQFSRHSPTKLLEPHDPEVSVAVPISPASSFNKETLKDLINKIPSSPKFAENNECKQEDNLVKEEIPSISESNSEEKFNNSTLKNPAERITIGKNADGLYKCIVGVSREAEIELINDSERWLVCKLHLMQIQGDRDNIHLEIPDYTILIKPNQNTYVKIVVKLLKNTGPVLAALKISCSDMTTRESSAKQHMMCFMPFEAQVDVIFPAGHHNKLNFTSVDSLPIVLQNKYDTDIPLEVSIIDDMSEAFSLKRPAEMIQDSKTSMLHLILKANEKISFEVNAKKQQSSSESSLLSKLIVRLHNELNNGTIIREIPMVVEKSQGQIEECNLSDEPRELGNYSRCETPQQPLMSSLPSSPHSVSSSGTSGFNKGGRVSPRSLSSGGTVTGDIIPIQSTHSSLSWTTVKVGKYEIKEFTIRNTSSNRIKLQATIVDNDKSFKFLKDKETSTNLIISLQRMESRTLTVVYGPTRTGASAGRITFLHYENKIKRSPGDLSEAKASRFILLFGCGGYAKVNIVQALKIIGAQMWLSLGKLNSNGTLTSRVQLQNSGDLSAYTKVTLVPKAVYPSVEASWHVEPMEMILGPKQSQWITIEFKPRKEDVALLKGDVAEMGTLVLTHGDEPTRWRIRRLYRKLIESRHIDPKQDDQFRHVVEPICRIFPGEAQLVNLSVIRDVVQDLGVLCRNVHRHVVTLMMDLDCDDTISIFTDDGDESVMFQSLCSDTSVVSVNNEDSYVVSESFLDRPLSAMQPRPFEDVFTVSPNAVILNPPNNKEVTVMITSGSSTAQPFDTKISNSEFLNVVPSGGMIPAKRGVLLKIQCRKIPDKPFQAVLHIFTSNEMRDVKIKIIPKRH